MLTSQTTPLILTYNEAPNIERTLAPLHWADEVVVVDSGSTDDTLELLARYPNVRVVSRAFDDHSTQWNFGVEQVRTPWVLALDADYVVSDELVAEIRELEPAAEGYVAHFRYCVNGRPLRGSLYPPRTVLFRRAHGRFVSDGHTQRLAVDGNTAVLNGRIYHDDRKALARWLENQRQYARLEADKLSQTGEDRLRLADRLRRQGLAPLLTPFYCLFVKGLIRDGAAGWRYTLERTYAEVLLALELMERRSRAHRPRT